MEDGKRLKTSVRVQRVSQYKASLLDKLKDYVINNKKSGCKDVPKSLNGEILLERHIHQGKVTGFVTAHPDDLATILPDIKKVSANKMGWKRWRDKFLVERSADIIEGVDDPGPDDYEVDI